MADNVLQRLRDKAGLKRKEPSKPLTEAELDAKAKERRANTQRGHTKPVPEYKESYADADTASLDRSLKIANLPRDIRGLVELHLAKGRKLAEARTRVLEDEIEILEARKDEYLPEDYKDEHKALTWDLDLAEFMASERAGARAGDLLERWEKKVAADKLSKKDIRLRLRKIRNQTYVKSGDTYELATRDFSGGRAKMEGLTPPAKTFKDYLTAENKYIDEKLTSMGLSGDVGINKAGEYVITKNQQRLIDRGNRGVDKATGLPKPVAPSTPSRAEAMARKPSQYDMPIVDPATGLPVNVNGSMAVEEVRNLMGLHRSLEQRKRDMNEIRSYLDKTMPTPSPVPRPF